ncbi:hypothetical protein KR044_001449 [Drosophila immigrans]|nr:hypothetical protein KR044_001449 [Drosophila immigrans]
MKVLPVLLLLMQLTAQEVFADANATAVANVTAAAATTTTTTTATTLLSAVNNNKNNATIAGASTKLEQVNSQPQNQTQSQPKLPLVDESKQKQENATVLLTRKVSKTDTATMPAATSAKPTTTSSSSSSTSTTTTTTSTTQTPAITKKSDKPLAEGISQSDIVSSSSNKTTSAALGSSSSTSTTTTTSSTTTTSTTSTTTTTTPKPTTKRPTKPPITISMSVPIAGEKDQQLNGAVAVDAASIKSDPISQPVQEMVSSSLPNRSDNDYLVPMVTVMVTVPLAIVVFVIGYRRFRDLWHTRHYRRMDFLVDGMYND